MISAKSRKNKIIAHAELFLIYAISHKLVYFYDVFRLPMRLKKRAKKQMEGKKLNSICRHFFLPQVALLSSKGARQDHHPYEWSERKVHSTTSRWYIARVTGIWITASRPVHFQQLFEP